MSRVLRSPGQRIGAAVTVVIAALLAAGGGWASSSPAAPSPQDSTAKAATPGGGDMLMAAGPPAAGMASGASAFHIGTNARGKPVPTTPPAGMNAEQWAALQEALRDHPQREAELARISAYMAFQALQTRYRELLTLGPERRDEARAIAASLLQELPAHVARGEVAGGEAILLQQSLFDTLGSDASARVQQRLALHDAIPVPQDVQAQVELDARYKREEAALVKDWGARPAAQRDPAALAEALDALRQNIFADAAETSGASSLPAAPLTTTPSSTTTTKTTGGSR